MNDRTDARWVTFQRIWSSGMGAWLLVQKRDGATRTVVTTKAAAR